MPADDPTSDQPTMPIAEPLGVLAGRFRLLRLLGHGGMGEVYEAEDLDLGRLVALKTIRPEIARDEHIVDRFKREIHLSQQVTHPNVCRIYDLGIHRETQGGDPVVFLTMELLRGETLAQRLRRGPMGTTEALPIVRQLASALDAAHQAGVIHRDFKSANVMLARSGTSEASRTVVTDFGLARTAATPVSGDDCSAQTNSFVGTPDYMAPEQVLGQPLTAAADIYAFGIVIYEMVAGRRPFQGDTPMARATIRLSQPPPSPREFAPNLDAKWEAAILRCLARMPGDRPESAAGVMEALDSDLQPLARPGITRRILWVAVPLALAALIAGGVRFLEFRSSAIDSLAILPLANATGDASLDYVGDGLTEDLINNVSQLARIRVISRNSVFQYKGVAYEAQAAGRRLAVRAVLTGSVARDPAGLAVSVELMDVATNRHLWGRRYQRPLADIAFLHDDIAEEMAGTLNPGGKANGRKRDTKSSEAWQLYTKGRFYWNKRTQEGFRTAIDHFRQALDHDPSYALAWSGLADSYMFLADSTTSSHDKAKAAAVKALEIDGNLAAAHAALGYIAYQSDWNWPEAERELGRSLVLDPNYATAHSMYARYLSAMGRADQALAESRRAVALDPLSLGVNTGLGVNAYLAHRYGEAIEQFRKTLELNPNFLLARLDLGLARVQSGQVQTAVDDFQRLAATSEDDSVRLNLAYAYARAGRRKDAGEELDKLNRGPDAASLPRYVLAIVHTALGDKDGAFGFLDEAYDVRDPAMPLLKVQPELEDLHGDARFVALLKRLKL